MELSHSRMGRASISAAIMNGACRCLQCVGSHWWWSDWVLAIWSWGKCSMARDKRLSELELSFLAHLAAQWQSSPSSKNFASVLLSWRGFIRDEMEWWMRTHSLPPKVSGGNAFKLPRCTCTDKAIRLSGPASFWCNLQQPQNSPLPLLL